MINLKKILKKSFVILLIILTMSYMIPFDMTTAATHVTISGPSIVVEGQSAVFNVKYSNDVIYINLSTGDIVLNGFQATVSVEGAGNSRRIVLKNVRGTGTGRSISIRSGTGYVGASKIGGAVSNAFKIKSKSEIANSSKPPVSNNNNTNTKPSTKPNTNTQPQKPATTPSKPQTPATNQNQTPNVNTQTNTNEKPSEEKKDEEVKKEEEKKEEENKEQKEEVKEDNINYDEKIPIPNTGK